MNLCALPLTGGLLAQYLGKVIRVLLVLGISTSVSAQSEASATSGNVVNAQPAPLPAVPRFDQPVSFRTGAEGEELGAMIEALARSVGLTAVTQGVPETIIRYDIGEPKPFREVWEIVLTLNGLEYVLRDSDIVVVGPPEALSGLRPQQKDDEPVVSNTYPVNSNPTQLQTLLQSQFSVSSGVVISAFDELGLISVRGTAAQQARVQETLERFDRSRVARVRRIYPLSYARASNLAGVLLGTLFSTNTLGSSEQRSVSVLCSADPDTGTVASQNPTDTAGATPTQDNNDTEAPLSISADPRTNRLIVTAPVSIQEEIEELIKTLDNPERQVNVQVRIQEVTTSASERLGINLTAAVDQFSTTLFSGEGGLNFVFDAQRAITGFNLGAILDVYEEQGLSRRVDDSNITVLNNGLATMQAGGRQYNYVQNSEGAVTQTPPINYGVIVGFTPQITNDNEVVLDICAQVNTPGFRDEAGRITDFATRNVNSRVTLAPGQTVVLGGLMQNQTTESSRSVPGLGDVPIIGNLFSTNSEIESNTELLVIVTANVLE